MLDNQYVDIDISFETINNEIGTVNDTEAIAQSLFYILMTEKGEIDFLPGFGTELSEILFSGMDTFEVDMLSSSIKFDLALWEPRAKITDVITTKDSDNRIVNVSIYFTTESVSGPVNELLVDLRRRLI